MTAYVDKVAVLRQQRAVLLEERQQFADGVIITGSPSPENQHHHAAVRRMLDARLTALDLEIIELGADPLE